MLQSYLPILIQGVLAAAVGTAILVVSRLVGVKRPTREKLSPYECGIAPVGDARERVGDAVEVKFPPGLSVKAPGDPGSQALAPSPSK